MQYQKLAAFFDARRARGEALVLATVVDTAGSTYSKAGACMLIDANGIFQGMLSGGCLEGDLAIRARAVVDTRRAALVTYELSGDDDELWGLGVGCDGSMRILLQLLEAKARYEPFATLAGLHTGDELAAAAIVVAAEQDAAPVGSAAVRVAGETRGIGLPRAIADSLEADLDAVLATGAARTATRAVDGGTVELLVYPVDRVPRLLVLGAGLDAEPVVRIAAELGWRTVVVDHRPHYVESHDFEKAAERYCCPADELAATVELDDVDVAIVMSHHLASDRSYLRQLAPTSIGYVGLLGPRARAERLVGELGAQG